MHIEIVRLEDVKKGESVIPINALKKAIRTAENKKHPNEKVKIVIKVDGKNLKLSNGSSINVNPELLVLRLPKSSS